jgi:hypothetical protein
MTQIIEQVTYVPVRGSTTVVVRPPRACGLAGCVGELEVAGKHGDRTIVHLDDEQRRVLIEGLGGLPQTYDPRGR